MDEDSVDAAQGGRITEMPVAFRSIRNDTPWMAWLGGITGKFVTILLTMLPATPASTFKQQSEQQVKTSFS